MRQIEQLPQGARLGRVHVIARQEPQPAPPVQQVPQVRLDQVEPAVHGEGHGDVDVPGQVDVGAQVRQQGIVAADDEGRMVGRSNDPRVVVADGILLPPVVLSVRYDPAHPADRIGHIAGVARDQMDVQVLDGLSRCLAFVDPDVEPVRTVLRLEPGLNFVQEIEELGALLGVVSARRATWRRGMMRVWPGETG